MCSKFDYPFSLTNSHGIRHTPFSFTSTNGIVYDWKLFVFGLNYIELELTRNNITGKVAIIVSLNSMRGDGTSNWNKHWSEIMDEGVPRVKKDFADGYCGPFRSLKGTVSIIHFPSQKTENFKQLPSQLSDDFLCLLNNPEFFPDATLKCGSAEILVHKGVLSKRSPVFAAMFKNKMQEGSGNIVHIVDIEPNILQTTLRYVYSGKTDQVTNATAGDILFVADKYDLDELKRICIGKLKSSITVGNVCRILVLGELHDRSLKTHAKEFVSKCGSFSKIEKTEEWKVLQAERPGLAMEVLCFVVKYLEEFQKNKC